MDIKPIGAILQERVQSIESDLNRLSAMLIEHQHEMLTDEVQQSLWLLLQSAMGKVRTLQ